MRTTTQAQPVALAPRRPPAPRRGGGRVAAVVVAALVVGVWVVAGAGHTAGLRMAPEEWRARVGAFLDDALEVRRG